MRKIKNTLTVIGLILTNSSFAQTTLSGGEIDGILTKAGSPYTVTSDITVPQGKNLTIEPGVEMYFNQHVKMTVYGLISAKGTASDSIVFTASDTALGWYGMDIRNGYQNAEEFTFSYCRFSYGYRIMRNSSIDHGILRLDSVRSISLRNCILAYNKSMRGSGIYSIHTNLSIRECTFYRNEALDTSSIFSTLAGEPRASCILAASTKLHIKKTKFIGNKSHADFTSQNDLGGRSTIRTFFSSNIIEDCVFTENETQHDGILHVDGAWNFTDSLKLNESKFLKNSVSSGAVLYLDISDDDYFKTQISSCLFEENLSGDNELENTASTILIYNAFGASNEVVMERCTLLNNDNNTGINMLDKALVYFNNGVIMGQRGTGVAASKNSNRTRFVNSVIANNRTALYTDYYSHVSLLNSTVAYNGGIKVGKYGFPSGIYYGDLGLTNVFNSIVTYNRSSDGKMANLVAGPRYYFPGLIYSSIIEGGVDSSFTNWWIDSTYRDDNVKFERNEKNDSFKIEFVKPPAGVGPDFASLDHDFHIKQTCNPTLAIDKGVSYLVGIANSNFPMPLDPWYGIDKDGNPRVQGVDMDPGPYEMVGENFESVLEHPWRDTVLCSNNLDEFSPQIRGADITYTWQSSSDNSSWEDVPSTNFSKNVLLQGEDETHYRVLTYQKECNVRDTFGVAKLGLLQSPEPNLGADTGVYRTADNIVLTPGDFKTYKWNSSDDLNASHYTLNENEYADHDHFIIWVEVTSENGCTAVDSIRVQILYGVGVDETEERLLTLFPNPSHDFIHVDQPMGKEATATIVGADGKVHLKTILDSSEPLSIIELSSGTYFLVVIHEGKKYTTRFIKE